MRNKSIIATAIGSTVVFVACSGPSDGPAGTSATGGDQAQVAPSASGAPQPRPNGATDAGAAPATSDVDSGDASPPPPPPTTTSTAQSLVWVWVDYANSISSVISHKSSFTHVSPAFYQMNYNYVSGVPQWWNRTTDDFDGLSSTQLTQKVHAAGMKVTPLLFAGGGNGGTDQGIHNVITDTPPGTASAFISAMVAEAVAKGYDGYNLDWEIDNAQTPYATYGAALESFLGTFKAALHAKGMQLSFDLGTWYLEQTFCSGGTGVVDLSKIGANVDLAIMEAYSNTLGATSTACPASLPNPALCSNDFMSELDLMCVYVPNANISIGFNANPSSSLGNNPIAADSVAMTQAFGIKNVAIWPDSNTDGPNGAYQFMDDKNNQQGTSWYTLLSNFLATASNH